MQPPFQQSAASAHIDDLMRAAQASRLASADRQGRQRRALSLGGIRAALALSVRKTQHA